MLEILEFKDWHSSSMLPALYEKSIRANTEGFRQDLENQMPILEFVKSVCLNGGIFLGAFLDRELVGILGLELKGQGYELCKFHVDSAFIGRGYGRALLERALKYDKKQFSLHVSKSQKRAIDLYMRYGFRVIREEDCRVLLRGEMVVFPTLFMQRGGE